VCKILHDHSNGLIGLKATGLVKAIDDIGLELLGNMPDLKELDIALCSKVTDDGLKGFARGKKRIMTQLNLTGLYGITNDGIKCVVLDNAATLQDLSLGLLSQKTVDGEMISAVCKCKGLRSLDLQGCVNLSNDSLYSLFSSGIEGIQTLNLSGIASCDDSIAISAMSSNKSLKVLRLSNCTALTFNFLDFITGGPCELVVLELNRTPLIKDVKIEEAIKVKAPNLRIIRATNYVVTKENGYKVHLPNINYVKPFIKGVTKPPPKKNDDKTPAAQLRRLLEERKPKRITELIF
jgi:hypothetical protein